MSPGRKGRTAAVALWHKALALPNAKDGDFVDLDRKPTGVPPEYVKQINDTALRSRLIQAGIAEGLQSPKGPQKIASIIRIYPNHDAPKRAANSPATTSHKGAEKASVPRANVAERPTVEELNTLLARIHEIETEVSRQMQGRINDEINRLKQHIAQLEGDAFERAFRELERILTEKREVAAQIRIETFKRIEADSHFDARKFLWLISSEPLRLT